MPAFAYKAKTIGGEVVAGTLTAGDRRSALAELGRLGYFPISVEITTAKPVSATRKASGRFRQRVGRGDVLAFTHQLARLLRSGLALSRALEVLEHRAQKPAWGAVLGAIRNDIVQGGTLSDALQKHPRLFSEFYVNLVRSGEASGALDQVLERLIKHYERMREIQEKVTTALLYPAFVGTVGIGTIIFFMLFMVPRFATMFREMGRTMPLPTQLLIGISDAFVNYWWIGAAAIVAVVVVVRQQARTKAGRLWLDSWQMRLPVLGGIVSANAFAQFGRTLAMLLENGVPVLQALQIVEDSMMNKVIANELREARARVTDGTSISQPLAKGQVFPPLLLDMLAVGEESGAVVEALKNIADIYEQELERKLRVFTTLLGPVIILFMALVVGSVVISILMAVFDITSGIGQ